MAIIYLGLGSNLGNRKQNLKNALRELSLNKLRILMVSNIIETKPVGGPRQGLYLNAVAKAQTTLLPIELLKTIKTIETRLGRKKTVRNGPRLIDIDILLYGQKVLKLEL